MYLHTHIQVDLDLSQGLTETSPWTKGSCKASQDLGSGSDKKVFQGPFQDVFRYSNGCVFFSDLTYQNYYVRSQKQI